MLMVERHNINGNPEIVRLCRVSKNIYNRCNYLMRQAWFDDDRLPDIGQLTEDIKARGLFEVMGNSKTAKQTVRRVLTDWSNFRKALTAYGKDKSKFIRKPKPPGYKSEMAQVVYYYETIKGGQSGEKLSQLTATNNCFSVPCDKKYKQVVITPKAFGFIIDVQYEAEEEKPKKKLNHNNVCTIDVGLNCVAAITLGQTRPVLINGRIVKSINQWYNKRPCKSRLKKRYFRLENYFHHVSKVIVDLCLEHDAGRIIIGKNLGWKTGINLGKKTNQAFSSVPFQSMIQKIQYKAAQHGITVEFTEEAYTSQASFYDRDQLPAFDRKVSSPAFSGQRKHRGLYVTGDGFALNADVNGSMNIGRKVIPEFFGIRDRSLAARPVIINPLKTRTR